MANFYGMDWHTGNALNMYLSGTRFEPRAGHRLSCLNFIIVFLSSSRTISGYYLY
jgi:hypothetical protein